MIKVYLDWNIISQMKNGNNDELLSILSNKDKFFIPYSTSHIGDILSSYSKNKNQQNLINEDLEFISTITNDYCFLNIKDEIVLRKINPKSIFNESLKNKDFVSNLKLENLLNGDNNEMGSNLISLLKSTPIDKPLKDAIYNSESSESLNIIFPNLKDNPTMEGLFNSFGELYKNLNNKEDYKHLRKIVQKGLNINRDKIFNEEDPYKIINNAYSQFNTTYNKHIDNSKYAPKWFNEISNEYLMLDMHGYQEDKVVVKKKKRKETFRNTYEDASHSAFASICNYYILNDNKSYKKVNQAFKKLNINTFIFKPIEFIIYYKTFLNFTDFNKQYNIIVNIIKTDNYVEKKIKNGIIKTYFLPFMLFDFFNSINIIFSEKEPIINLSRMPATNENITYYFEIINLVSKFYKYFGNDVNNFGEINNNELLEDNWNGRLWVLDKISIRLIISGGHIQLYFDAKQ